jgi:ferritin-like metal-binding protein YciE
VEANSLQELYLGELKDLYDAEHQIIKALPKMISKASSEELKSALNEHLEVTRQQAERLEQLFEQMGEKAKAQKCKGIEGIIKEGSELLQEVDDEDTRDVAIIASAQKVEHYEIASYGTVRTWANLLGQDDAAQLLEQTLNEEKEADQKLTDLSESLNVEADAGEVDSEQARPKRTTKSKRAA